MQQVPHPDHSGGLASWSRQIYEYLATKTGGVDQPLVPEAILLARLSSNSRASTDGILLFDPVTGVPVYSYAGVFHPIWGETTSLDYDLSGDGLALTAGNTAVPGMDVLLTPGTYSVDGFATLVTDGSAPAAGVFYMALTSDLTTPVGSVISGSITLPAVADTAVQVPISGDLTVTAPASYSLVARTPGSALSLGKSHGMVGLTNRYARLNVLKR